MIKTRDEYLKFHWSPYPAMPEGPLYSGRLQNQYIGDVVGTVGISEVMMNNTIEKGGENNYDILDNNVFIGYPDDHPYEMISSNTCTKGYWSPNNIKLYHVYRMFLKLIIANT